MLVCSFRLMFFSRRPDIVWDGTCNAKRLMGKSQRRCSVSSYHGTCIVSVRMKWFRAMQTVRFIAKSTSTFRNVANTQFTIAIIPMSIPIKHFLKRILLLQPKTTRVAISGDTYRFGYHKTIQCFSFWMAYWQCAEWHIYDACFNWTMEMTQKEPFIAFFSSLESNKKPIKEINHLSILWLLLSSLYMVNFISLSLGQSVGKRLGFWILAITLCS